MSFQMGPTSNTQRATHDHDGWLIRLLTHLRSRMQPHGVMPRSLRHVETLSLGAKRSIVLIECDGQRFLVTSGGDNLSAPVALTQRFATVPDGERNR